MIRTPSISDVNRMNKDDLKKTLKELINNLKEERESVRGDVLADEDTNIGQLLSAVLSEVKELRQEKQNLKQQIVEIRQENKALTDAVWQHQRFLESLDAEKRNTNLIVTGVPEDTNITTPGTSGAPAIVADQDDTKVSLILQKIGQKDAVNIVKVVRLGNKTNRVGTRPRPIKIVTSTPQERKKILEASKKLKNEDGIFKKIYLNKDIHPLIRKELNRIRWVEKQEKGKPENAGRTVKYDHESRCVTVDDLVVDRFKPMFF